MKRIFIFRLKCCLFLIVLTGCGKPPEEISYHVVIGPINHKELPEQILVIYSNGQLIESYEVDGKKYVGRFANFPESATVAQLYSADILLATCPLSGEKDSNSNLVIFSPVPFSLSDSTDNNSKRELE